jgi:hypothetical protein
MIMITGCSDKSSVNIDITNNGDVQNTFNFNEEVFNLQYELPNGTNIYYGEHKSILINNSNGNEILSNDPKYGSWATLPELSPNKKNIAYVSPYEFETLGNVYVYDSESDTYGKVVEVDIEKQDSAKVVKWIDDDKLLIIIGFGYGTVSEGGDLYLYNRETEKLTLVKESEGNTEVIGIKINEEIVELEIAVFDENWINYEKSLEYMSLSEIYEIESSKF